MKYLYILLFIPFVVFAEGGQVGKPDLSPITTEEGCVIIVPAGIDLEDCLDTQAQPQSGISSWICNGVTVNVVCPEDD